MNVDKAIAGFGKALDSLDDVAKHLLNAADPEGTKKDLKYYQNALAECKRMGSQKGTSPTSFVAAISKSLRKKPALLALLDVNYESDCNVNFMTSNLMKKHNEDVAVMLPDDFYKPYLRYKISNQIDLPDNFPWDMKMVSASNIEEWISFNSAHPLQSFAEKILLITHAFPNRDTITTYIKEAIDATSKDDFERVAFHASLESNGENIGTTENREYACYLPTTIASLKEQLVKKIFEGIAECIGTRVAQKISEYILDKLKKTLNIDIGKLRKLVSSETFQTVIVIYVQGVLVTSIFLIGAGLFGWTLAEAGALSIVGFATGTFVFMAFTAASAAMYTILFSVDINSRNWRGKVARETLEVFNTKRENLKKEVSEKATSELDSKFRESEENLMKSHKEMCGLVRDLQMTNRDHTVEIFSNEDFERMKGISVSAKDFLKTISCLESIGCVAARDKFECVLQGETSQQESGSEVVVVLHKEKVEETVTDFPLVFIDVQRNQEEYHKIQRFKKKNKIEGLDDRTYQEIRGRLDSELLLSLASSHSNLVAIDICTTKSSMGGDIIDHVKCIVIYCFAKGFIPIGENVFPKEIMGIQTDVREAYALALGTRDYNNPLGPGCSIGLENHKTTGSIGFFLRHKHDGHLAFLSSAHVFFGVEVLRKYADGHYHFPLHELRVVQPSDEDSRGMAFLPDRICGRVESIHFNKTGEEKCKDFIVVASETFRHPGNILRHPSISAANRRQSGCYNWPTGYDIQDIGVPSTEGPIDGTVTVGSVDTTVANDFRNVIKIGRTTDLTRGKYVGPLRMVIVRDGNGGSFILFDMLQITPCRNTLFSEPGDSGAAIFLKSVNILDNKKKYTLKPFGIVEARLMQTNLTAAIPVTEFKLICEDYELQSFDREEHDLEDDDDDDEDDDDEADETRCKYVA